MKTSDKSEDVVCKTFKCYLNRGSNSCCMGKDENMQAGFVDFPDFAQGFNFASWEAICEAREF